MSDGCGVTVACGGMTTELAKGKTLGEALNISAEDINSRLGGSPKTTSIVLVLHPVL